MSLRGSFVRLAKGAALLCLVWDQTAHAPAASLGPATSLNGVDARPAEQGEPCADPAPKRSEPEPKMIGFCPIE